MNEALSPRPVAATPAPTLPPSCHSAPAGAFFRERRNDQRRVRALLGLVAMALAALAACVLLVEALS